MVNAHSIARAGVRFKRNSQRCSLFRCPMVISSSERCLIRQHQRQPARSALAGKWSPRRAAEVTLAASRTLEGVQAENIDSTQQEGYAAAGKGPSDDRADDVAVADQVGDSRAHCHPREQRARVVELA